MREKQEKQGALKSRRECEVGPEEQSIESIQCHYMPRKWMLCTYTDAQRAVRPRPEACQKILMRSFKLGQKRSKRNQFRPRFMADALSKL